VEPAGGVYWKAALSFGPADASSKNKQPCSPFSTGAPDAGPM
jgi:hypothetical protein